MKRSPIVRIQTFLLFLVCALVIWRATSDPDGPPGEVSLGGIDVGNLRSEAFSIERDGRIRIDATGSRESESGAGMAAFPWIVRAEDRQVVWSLADTGDRSVPFLVHRVDTLELTPGGYELYFTTFGQTRDSRNGTGFLRLKPHWTNDASEWGVAISSVDSVGLSVIPDAARRRSSTDLLWDSRESGSAGQERLLISTAASVARVDAVGLICERRCDEVRIENALTSEPVWVMTAANSISAGGHADNRSFGGEIELTDGMYRVVYSSHWGTSPSDWPANPPLDPASWGLRIAAVSGDLAVFDPWTEQTPVVSMLRVGDDQLLRTVIEVTERTRVYVDAMGELMDSGSRYDYAWIEKADSRERIWEQDAAGSTPAGGDSSNQRAAVFLSLEPGRYSVYYQTDGSHSFEGFNRSRPDHPERWGVAVFAVGTDAQGSVQVVEAARDAHETVVDVEPVSPPSAPPTPIPPIAGESLFSAIGVGNDREMQGSFELTRPTRIRIVAVGEMTRGGRYDYGWIETSTGDVAWEMSMSNTMPAGGDDRNRLFDGVITLPAGTYRAHYQTDFSHAFGDFDSGGPADPGAWGMRIVRMPE